FFDYIPMADGRLGIVLADVSGHGYGSALIMSSTRRLLRVLAETKTDLGSLLGLANRAIFEDTDGTRWVTLFFAILDHKARIAVHAADGHEGYLLTQGGAVKRMEGTGPPIGMLGTSAYSCGQPIELVPGDVIILVTDGFLEAQNPQGSWFGIEGVIG